MKFWRMIRALWFLRILVFYTKNKLAYNELVPCVCFGYQWKGRLTERDVVMTCQLVSWSSSGRRIHCKANHTICTTNMGSERTLSMSQETMIIHWSKFGLYLMEYLVATRIHAKNNWGVVSHLCQPGILCPEGEEAASILYKAPQTLECHSSNNL